MTRRTGQQGDRRVRGAILAIILVASSLAGCSESLPSIPSMPRLSDLNPFAEKQVPLPGKRLPVALSDNTGSIELAKADRPIAVPGPVGNDSWPQPGGSAANALGHVALSAAPRNVWSGDVGQGSSRQGRLISSPVVAEGRVFTLDTNGLVTAFAAAGGSAVWRTSTAPEGVKGGKGYGGGLAFDAGRLFVVNGFGIAASIDPSSGRKAWERSIGVPVRTSPTAAQGKLFFAASDGRAFALSQADGSELWAHRGIPERASIVTNASPAVDGDIVVFPYASGELVAMSISSGQVAWSESLARTRVASSLTSMSDASRPAIESGTLYAVGHAGRMVATSVKNGERIWQINVPGLQAPWVAGEIVYVVDTGGQLMALTRRDGRALWTVRLPGSTSWSGPVLAGGRLWVASDKGAVVGVDAATGRVDQQLNAGAPVYIAPIVAGGRMYVLTDRGRLLAFQ